MPVSSLLLVLNYARPVSRRIMIATHPRDALIELVVLPDHGAFEALDCLDGFHTSIAAVMQEIQ